MSKKVKISMLKSVASPAGTYQIGKVYEVDEALAKSLTTPVKSPDGQGYFVKALLVHEDQAVPGQPGIAKIAIKDLSVGDMVGLGIKNIVETPADPKYDEFLKRAGAVPSDNESAKNRKNRMEKRQELAKSPE